MKLKALLAAASVAALSAGAAHALDVESGFDDNGILGGGVNTAGPLALAEELDFTLLPTGEFVIIVSTNGTIPPGQNVFMTLDFTGVQFVGALTGGAAPTDEVTAGATGAVVDSGGADNGSSVRYLITTDGGNTGAPPFGAVGVDYLQIELPVEATDCDITVTLSEFETEAGGNNIEGGSFPAETFSSCTNAFAASVMTDEATTPSFLDPSTAPSFAGFIAGGPDAVGTGQLALFELDVDTTAHKTLAGDGVALADVIGGEIDLTLGTSTTGLDEWQADPGIFAFFSDTEVINLLTETLNFAGPPATAADTGVLDVTTTGLATIAAQTVSVTDSLLDLDGAWYNDEPFEVTTAEDLKYGGAVFGQYDWVSDKNRAVNNVFRVTGLSSSTDTLLYIRVANSTLGVDGVYEVAIPAADVNNGEYLLNRNRLSDLLEGAGMVDGLFGRADLTFIFGTANDLDVDRLLSSPATAAVASFGDGANILSGGGTIVSPLDPTLDTDNDDDGARGGFDDF